MVIVRLTVKPSQTTAAQHKTAASERLIIIHAANARIDSRRRRGYVYARVDGVWLCPKLASTACGYVQAVGWHPQISAVRRRWPLSVHSRPPVRRAKAAKACEIQQ